MHVLLQREELPGFPAMVNALAGDALDARLADSAQVLWPEHNGQPPQQVDASAESVAFRVRLFPHIGERLAPAEQLQFATAAALMQNHLLVCCYEMHSGSAMGVALVWQQPSAEGVLEAACTAFPQYTGAAYLLFVTYKGHQVAQSPYRV